MRKKCVQTLERVWMNMWNTLGCTHTRISEMMSVNNYTVLPCSTYAPIHTHSTLKTLCQRGLLSTLPTPPITITLFLKNTLVNHRGGVV